MEEKIVTITICEDFADELYDLLGRMIGDYDRVRALSDPRDHHVRLDIRPVIYDTEALAMKDLFHAINPKDR